MLAASVGGYYVLRDVDWSAKQYVLSFFLHFKSCHVGERATIYAYRVTMYEVDHLASNSTNVRLM